MDKQTGIGESPQTPEWWDYQLAHAWELNEGPAQTLHFMTRLIASLPGPDTAFLSENDTTILDWGCAMGEGVAALAEAFPRSRVTGIDLAPSAINAARARFPLHEFMVTENGSIPERFDVIVTSNVIEHLTHPFDTIREHLASCRLLYLALVPQCEYPLMEGHLTTFVKESFPRCLGSFVRLFVREVSTDPRIWFGDQLLAGYASREYLGLRPDRTDDNPATSFEAYFRASPRKQRALETIAMKRARAESVSWLLRARALNALRHSLVPYGSRRDRFLSQLRSTLKG